MPYEWDILPGNSGVRPLPREAYLTAHGTVTAGTVYSLDTTTATAANNGIANASAAAVDGATEGTVWVLALESGVSGDRLKFLLRGYADSVTNDGTDIAAGAALASDASGNLIAAVAGDVIIGVAPEAITATSGPAWFDGAGIASKHA